LVIQSLNLMERPVLAGLLRTGDRGSAWHTVSLIRTAALGAWAASVILAFIVVRWFLDDFVHEAQDPSQITAAVILWAAIFGLRCLRGPESTLIQADGLFRPLAMATVYSGLVTLPLVTVLAYTHGAVWSLLGVLVGELVATASIILLARKAVAPA
jgi:putative peptidoglycan lipid II flippase